MALFPAGASLLVYYPRVPESGGSTLLTSSVRWRDAAREGNITRLFSARAGAGFLAGVTLPQGTPPSYPLGAWPPVAVAGSLPVPPIPVGYSSWGMRRIAGTDWVEIGDVVSIDSPMSKTGQAGTTVLKSLNVAKESIPGWEDGDTCKVKARHSRRLYNFIHAPLATTDTIVGGVVTAAGAAIPDAVDVTGLSGPLGGLYRLTTLFAIVLPPNFGQGELVFGSQVAFAGYVQDKGDAPFSAENDNVIDLDFTIKITGVPAQYPGA